MPNIYALSKDLSESELRRTVTILETLIISLVYISMLKLIFAEAYSGKMEILSDEN